MLEPHDAPECITHFVAHAELSDADYMLYAAGRAVAFAREWRLPLWIDLALIRLEGSA
jgi:hypothetical protein